MVLTEGSLSGSGLTILTLPPSCTAHTSASVPSRQGWAAQVLLLLVIRQLPLQTVHMARLPREHNLPPLAIHGSSY